MPGQVGAGTGISNAAACVPDRQPEKMVAHNRLKALNWLLVQAGVSRLARLCSHRVVPALSTFKPQA
jgi:hypothetical protein